MNLKSSRLDLSIIVVNISLKLSSTEPRLIDELMIVCILIIWRLSFSHKPASLIKVKFYMEPL